jgi:hypothetical protein
MRIIADSKNETFGVNWKPKENCLKNKRRSFEFYSKDGWTAQEIYLKKNDDEPYFEMSLYHEIGHILSVHKFCLSEFEILEITPHNLLSKILPMPEIKRMQLELFRFELVAWRLAKGLCEPKNWNEEYAIKKLKTYDCQFPIKWERFKVIPLYKI